MASIAAVSHFELLTCPDDQDGTRLLMQGGQLDERQGIGKNAHQDRATVLQHTARLKFLKTNHHLLQHIQQGLTNQALAYLQRQFKLVHNQQLLINPTKPTA